MIHSHNTISLNTTRDSFVQARNALGFLSSSKSIVELLHALEFRPRIEARCRLFDLNGSWAEVPFVTNAVIYSSLPDVA